MKIKLKTRRVYGTNAILPACNRSEALFKLIGRPTLTMQELSTVFKMGFEIEIVGEVKELASDLKDNDIPHSRVPGRIVIDESVSVTIHHPSDVKPY